MAGILCLGVLATWLCEEPQVEAPPPRNWKESVIDPFVEYFSRPGAWMFLLFILLYKVGDNMASQMTMPFYLDMGYTRTEVGAISKVVGWVGLAIGGLLGGALILRLKLFSALFWFGFLQAFSTFGFVGLAMIEKSTWALTGVIGFENFTAGLGTSAFAAFMASLTNKKFTATQFALLTSFMGIPRTILSAPTGWMAQNMGWVGFFVFCTLIALPGILMISPMRRRLEN